MKNKIKWNLNNFKPPRPFLQKKYTDYNLKQKKEFKHYFYLIFASFFLSLKKIGINLRSYPDQFAHQGFDIEYFLREEKRKFGSNIFIVGSNIPNQFLYTKHKKLLTIIKIPKWLLKKLYTTNKISKKYFGDHIWSNVEYDYKKIDIVKKNWSDKESKILFTKKEMDYGEELLNNLGLSKFNYVVFGSRNEKLRNFI